MAERPANDRVLDGPSAERRLRSNRAGADMGPDGARIAVPGEGDQPLARGTAEKPGHRAWGAPRQVADGNDAAFGESRPGRRADAPHHLHRQIMEEAELGLRVDDNQP